MSLPIAPQEVLSVLSNHSRGPGPTVTEIDFIYAFSVLASMTVIYVVGLFLTTILLHVHCRKRLEGLGKFARIHGEHTMKVQDESSRLHFAFSLSLILSIIGLTICIFLHLYPIIDTIIVVAISDDLTWGVGASIASSGCTFICFFSSVIAFGICTGTSLRGLRGMHTVVPAPIEAVDVQEDGEMFFECIGPPESNVCICSDSTLDHDCLARAYASGEGYLYISPAVVQFHWNARTVELAREKAKRIADELRIREGVENAALTIPQPVFCCLRAARERKLDLDIAKTDCVLWWNERICRLRSTPTCPPAQSRPNAYLADDGTDFALDDDPQPENPDLLETSQPMNETLKYSTTVMLSGDSDDSS